MTEKKDNKSSLESLEIFNPSINQAVKKLAEVLQHMVISVSPLKMHLDELNDKIRKITEPLDKLCAFLVEREKEVRLLESVGLLPHYTTPFHIFNTGSPEENAKFVVDFYDKNWSDVKNQFNENLTNYLVDDEAKTVFAEALSNHEIGHFRSVPRLLFPEIERVFRCELAICRNNSISSLKDLRGFGGQLTASDIKPSGYHGFHLFKKLDMHLYADTKKLSDSDFEKLLNDPVPNRHASLHGLVIYSSKISSLNVLIMTDYIFQIMTVYKTNPEYFRPV